MTYNSSNNFTAIKASHSTYPPLLRQIPDAPQQLFIAGCPLDPHDSYIAIVGTRRTGPYGKKIAHDFSFILAQAGFVVVSGLAMGIDTAAHAAALGAGGKTIAILGSGLNTITPSCNANLAQEVKKNGTLISEYENNTPAYLGNFPKRNRIIAGMSLATVIIEAPEKSGALITARLALEYNREVFAVPGNILHESSRGTNKLIQAGHAQLVTSPQEILTAFGMGKTQEPTQRELPFERLSHEENKIYELLQRGPFTFDMLIAETGMSSCQVVRIVSTLEVKGLATISGAHVLVAR